jgi:hypothetical protein
MGVLRSNVNVRRLFFAQNVSVMGDYFTYVALVGLIKGRNRLHLLGVTGVRRIRIAIIFLLSACWPNRGQV